MTIESLETRFVDDSISWKEKRELIYQHQLSNIDVYKTFVDALGSESNFEGPPTIPIDIFKVDGWYRERIADLRFKSSATGGIRSTHHIRRAAVYELSIQRSFQTVFGSGPFTIASHLPGYTEAGEESSLLYMIRHLIKIFGNSHSGSFLGEARKLNEMIIKSEERGDQLLVFGAAFGLVDFLECETLQLPSNSIVIETGGMKTHRKEMDRRSLHERLAEGFGLERNRIYSEYGMCEMLSQSYTRGGEAFRSPPWMEVAIVDPEAPWRKLPDGEVGAIAVFDCANMHSISSILTKDRGRRTPDGFEVLGRLQSSELRGCNFLIEGYLR